MTELTSLEATRDGEDDVLPGALVRDLVTRNEEAIDALLVRLAEAEREADSVEQSVRDHPAVGWLSADEVARLVPEASEPTVVDDGRPRTTVVDRPAAPLPSTGRARTSVAPRAGGAGEEPQGFMARLTHSHLWWRIGIALVVVALLLVKLG